MALFVSFFVLIVAVTISDVVARWIPAISNSYINLFMGILIAWWPVTNQLILKLNSETFMVLILAPLLFFEGQRTQVVQVRRQLKQILGSAGALAIVSAALATVVLHVALSMTLALALVAVAISTPTDATALDSVIAGRKFPQRIRTQLTLESLFNDATGLVLLQAGILWWQTGHLSILQNTGELLLSAGGGVVVGVVLAVLAMTVRQILVRTEANVVSSQTLLYILTPIIIYLIAEKVGVSGIIAVVVAGLTSNSEANRSRLAAPRQMHLGLDLVNFSTQVLNGIVFVILGLNLERIFSEKNVFRSGSRWLLLGMTIYLVLLGCRLVYGKLAVADKTWRSGSLFALGGVHGTVTLAMTFSLSDTLSPAFYEELLLIEVVVIILSMLTPTLLFRWRLPLDWDLIQRPKRLREMRAAMVERGIAAVKAMDLPTPVYELVIYDLEDQLRQNTIGDFFRQWHGMTAHPESVISLQSEVQRQALMRGLNAERAYLGDLLTQRSALPAEIDILGSELLLAQSLILDSEYRLY